MRMLVFVVSVMVLTACTTGQGDDIQAWMAQQEQTMVGGVKPLPEIKPFPVVDYDGDALLSPFDSGRIEPEARAEESTGGPDLARPKEPLEAYPLESLNMLGFLTDANAVSALVKADQTLYQVRVGNYMGQNYGLVTDIQETEVTLLELVQDPAGDWVERTSKLLLQEQ